MLFAFTAQVDDRLEQKAESVVFQGFLNRFHRIALIQCFEVGRVVHHHTVAFGMTLELAHFRRRRMRPGHELLGLRRVLGN